MWPMASPVRLGGASCAGRGAAHRAAQARRSRSFIGGYYIYAVRETQPALLFALFRRDAHLNLRALIFVQTFRPLERIYRARSQPMVIRVIALGTILFAFSAWPHHNMSALFDFDN